VPIGTAKQRRELTLGSIGLAIGIMHRFIILLQWILIPAFYHWYSIALAGRFSVYHPSLAKLPLCIHT
jgi:hypothetical protein